MGTDCDCQHARYARTQFTDPNLGQAESADAGEDEGEFYENSADHDDHDEEDIAEEAAKPLYKMDPDQCHTAQYQAITPVQE